MNPKRVSERPYNVPEPRSFSDWCVDLGLECVGDYAKDENCILSYDKFTYYPNVKFYKTVETKLYGFWRSYGDVWGECRTINEWLNDLGGAIVMPTDNEMSELNLFLGYDEFRNWSSGIVEYK